MTVASYTKKTYMNFTATTQWQTDDSPVYSSKLKKITASF